MGTGVSEAHEAPTFQGRVRLSGTLQVTTKNFGVEQFGSSLVSYAKGRVVQIPPPSLNN